MIASSSVAYRPLKAAEPVLDGRGIPYSREYGDTYHCAAGAFAQARHVFLRGNGLPDRWQDRERFTVCETGFGLGTNFLALWQAWRADPRRSLGLHVVSFEAHPLHRRGLASMLLRLAPDDEIRELGRHLVAAWPPLLPGVHRLDFEKGCVTLTLAFGDAPAMVPALEFAADAFFLDGFSPARNPEMWTAELLKALGEHAVRDATAATWCSAGAVRRALQEAGFHVERRPGLAGKLHMTVARRSHGLNAPLSRRRDVVVVGGGIAGAAIAHALHLRNMEVTVVEAAAAGAAHAGHAAAALTPLVSRDDNVRARLSRAGSQRALGRWLSLPGTASPLLCGTLQLARDAGKAADAQTVVDAMGFPASWVRSVDVQQATELAGLPVARGGLYFGDGMLVRPHALIAGLASQPGVSRITANIGRVSRRADTWQLYDASDKPVCQASELVLANAMGACAVLQASGLLAPLPRLAAMHALAGEVTLLPAAALRGGPRCIVGGEGYLLPAVQDGCVAGSTYVHGASASRISPEGQQANIGKAAALLGGALDMQSLHAAAGYLPGWAGWRAVMPGRLPAIGPVAHAPGLHVATGFASRGLSWAALAGDIIAAHLCGEPALMETDLMAAVAPR